ncbi:MAG: hypothetical protein GXO79_13455 [Chlorobi bacterium]|nr:hypothetical protein [Chlorobiota bacterium]
MGNKTINKLIVSTLAEKSCMKQKVYDNTLEAFQLLKSNLKEITNIYNRALANVDDRVNLEYKDKGAFETELKVAGDVLIFTMHSNIFEFDRDHGIWKTSYIKSNKLCSYTGIINIYNFLTDSLKYNRVDDLGYLIGRIFINKDKHFFVEGKRQLGFLYNDFGRAVINEETIRQIIESAILYTLEFDLLVPPYDTMKIVSVGQMNEKINKSKTATGKRLGFKFYADNDFSD